MKDKENQIVWLLQNMKQFYIERKPENIGKLQKLFFDDALPPIIIGTGSSEWKYGISEAKEIFLSDWDGWGNVSIDLSSLEYDCFESMAWFHVKAGVEYSFKDSDDKYKSYMESVCKIAGNGKSALCRTSEIIWLLSHLLHTRDKDERRYKWDMTISGTLRNIDGAYKFKTIQFSVPVLAVFPDVRINTTEYDSRAFEKECSKINNYNSHLTSKNDGLKNEILKLFCSDGEIELNCERSRGFIGTDGIRRNGLEFKNYIKDMKGKGISVLISAENIISEVYGDMFYFCGLGVFSKKISLNEELDGILNNIGYYYNMNDKKDALFKVRRDLSLVLKECSSSNECDSPFRIEGMGRVTEKEKICLEYAQLSYPFNWILEQKTDAQVEL